MLHVSTLPGCVVPLPGRAIDELRFFGGLGVEDTATVMGISPRLVEMEWGMARAWLYRQLRCA